MIGFVRVATFDKSGTGATSILQGVVWVRPKRQLRNTTLGSLLALLTLLAQLSVHPGSQTPVVAYRIPRHTGFSPHRSKYLGEEPVYVRLSGEEGGEPTATVALSMGVFDLIQPPTPISEVFTLRVLRKKRKKRMK